VVETKPVVVCDRSGFPVAVVRTSKKGFKKSTERGQLWLIDETTERLLPMAGEHRLHGIVERAGFYLATLDREPSQAPDASPRPSATSRDQLAAGGNTGVLEQLQTVIAERHASMPEGSYTTHLFREGLDKIRKKTGEEAVELILARTDDEIVSESADLVYHLLVLLQASGLRVEAVLDNLAGRMK
jgi:phosphoribosyl-ATP pyrophosphohydrolase